MKVRLLHPDRDFDLTAVRPPQATTVAQDLGLHTLVEAMAGNDKALRATAEAVLLAATGMGEAAAIAHRQAGIADALAHPQAVRTIHALATEAIESRRRNYLGIDLSDHAPSTALYGAVELLRTFSSWLRKLHGEVGALQGKFRSNAFTGLFASVRENLDGAYLDSIDAHIETLGFRHGVLLEARLGGGNTGTAYGLRLPNAASPGWLKRLFGHLPPTYTWRLPECDEAGARVLREIRDLGIARTTDALVQSAGHVLQFFESLRAELAFYVGALNLHDRLQAAGVPVCLPAFATISARCLQMRGLRNPVLALSSHASIVPSDCDADGSEILLVTGANQGGKSTFLRALGLAQVMLHAGLFIAADEYTGTLRSGVFTHAHREEDASLRRGKFDEELQRLAAIASQVRPGAVVLFNEPFAATNERDGSEVALEVFDALRERGIAVWCVSHLATLARSLASRADADVLLLRAERRDDGSRSFVIRPGEPLDTSFGDDLYQQLFDADAPTWQ